MSARASRLNEIIRIAIMTLFGGLLMWGTKFLFEQDWLLGGFVTKVNKDEWISGEYSFWATLVFVISTITTILWYTLGCIVPNTDKNLLMRIPWMILSAIPLITIVIFVFVNTNKEVEWLCIFFFIVIGYCGYWLSTALNSPAPFQFIPPLSQELRHIFKLN
jgi:predicted membrane channel-forming protein YqfA (hemolysin III family)